MRPGKAQVGRFSDGEVNVETRKCPAVATSRAATDLRAPTNDNPMELVIMVDALKRASAGRTPPPCRTSVTRVRIAVHARLRRHLGESGGRRTAVGVDRVLTMDLHADQIQGFFNIPVDNIYATLILLADIQQKYDNLWWCRPDVAVVVRAARWRSVPTPIWPSSTNVARRRTCRK